jgi:peptidoglycan/LPS O-acetylase OafA/YrhL
MLAINDTAIKEDERSSAGPQFGNEAIRFALLDGLRGWLACSVVLTHVIFLAKLDEQYRIAQVLRRVGDDAVMVFIILSGFVITHLILSKKESYSRYITRRFFRIFPVFAVCTIIAAVTALLMQGLTANWTPTFRSAFGDYQGLVNIPGDSFSVHMLAHITMFHGAIPNELLPRSSQAFLAPGWSLSLEWQFYLLAPLIVLFAAGTWSRTTTVIVAACVGIFTYATGATGTFQHPSLILAAAIYFVVGIGTRLFLPFSNGLRWLPVIILSLAALLIGRSSVFFPFAVWSCVVALILLNGQIASKAGSVLLGASESLLRSHIAIWLGRRSYSIYLSHAIVLVVVQYWILSLFPVFAGLQHAALLILASAPLIILASELLYRLVERPGMTLGHKVAQKFV